jgi:hypothetical protein
MFAIVYPKKKIFTAKTPNGIQILEYRAVNRDILV